MCHVPKIEVFWFLASMTIDSLVLSRATPNDAKAMVVANRPARRLCDQLQCRLNRRPWLVGSSVVLSGSGIEYAACITKKEYVDHAAPCP
jgi:hypothetical protein